MKKILLFMFFASSTLALAGCWGNKDKGSDLSNLTIQGGEKDSQNTGSNLDKSKVQETSIKLENVNENSISLKQVGFEETGGKVVFYITGQLQGYFNRIDVAGLPVKDKFEVVDFSPSSTKFTIKITASEDAFVENKMPLVIQALNEGYGKAQVRQQAVYILLDK